MSCPDIPECKANGSDVVPPDTPFRQRLRHAALVEEPRVAATRVGSLVGRRLGRKSADTKIIALRAAGSA